MAYDKIITLRGRMDHCIDYVLDEEKTGLANALSYSENPEKTQRLVTGINCDPETALADMNATKRRWDKKGGVLGYHLIHSYAPGEVTPEEAHSAGVEFAERLLGQRYEAVVCTHTDHDHLHCHIVFNSVSFVDGKKYRSDFKSYFGDIRGTSNEVSRERGLSVIEPEGSGRHYAEWDAERSGKGTIRGLVRQDIDAAVAESFTYDSFLAALRRQGYTIKRGPKVKHTAVRPPGAELFSLAVVDPPYGIHIRNDMGRRKGRPHKYKAIRWDAEPAPPEYFRELRRVSVHQIIWGANHFISRLPAADSHCWLCWDKKYSPEVSYASFELAWTNFNTPCKRIALSSFQPGRIHPTQKPVALYAWIYEHFAKPGDSILDTHLGSGSSRIAAYDAGLDFVGYEIDADYFAAQERRFAAHVLECQRYRQEETTL